MNVQFRQLNGKIFKLALNGFETFGDVKQKIAAHLNSQADSIKLLLQTTVLPDNKTLADYSIDGSSIIKIQGGKSQKSPLNILSSSSNSTTELNCFDQSSQKEPEALLLPPRKCNLLKKVAEEKFQKQVTMLCEMGFERQKAIRATKASCFNEVKALDYLLQDNVPKSTISDISVIEKDRENYSRNDIEEERNEITQLDSQTMSPFEKLTANQRREMMALQELGFDREQIIQVYLACGDCNTAVSCLLSMNSPAGCE